MYYNPPGSKARREVKNLTERKHVDTPFFDSSSTQKTTVLERVSIKIFQSEFQKYIFIIFTGDNLCKG